MNEIKLNSMQYKRFEISPVGNQFSLTGISMPALHEEALCFFTEPLQRKR